MPIYDDFSASELDQQLWNAVVPGSGIGAGRLDLHLERGECCLCLDPLAQGASGPASVFLSTRTWPIGRDPMAFSTTLAVAAEDGGPGSAGFGVFDATGGTVIGFAVTGHHILAVARESGDPLAPLSTGALEFSDLAVSTEPLRRHDLKIEYDPQRRIARWYVDAVMQLYREVPFDPHELTCAFGILPLRQVDPGAPAPQINATWGQIQYQDEGELEPDPLLAAQPG
jgi:hypothetical protein